MWAVVHHRLEIVGTVVCDEVFCLFFLKYQLRSSQNSIQVNFDIVIAVRTGMLVSKTQSVTQFVEVPSILSTEKSASLHYTCTHRITFVNNRI